MALKDARLWAWLEAQDLDGVLIQKRSNFAWYTGGARNHIFLASGVGACALAITREGKYLIAHSMDGERTMAEEVAGLGLTLRAHQWYEGRMKVIDTLVSGLRMGADLPVPDFTHLPSWWELTTPLLPSEVDRLRDTVRHADAAIGEVGRAIRPGMTELQVAGMLAEAYTGRGFTIAVLLVGSDDRPFQYRHCLPTAKELVSHVLIHVAAERNGLYANLSRIVHFGSLPPELRAAHDALAHIFGAMLAFHAPGRRFADLLEHAKQAYATYGFPREWQEHFQGGISGYEAGDPYVLLDTDAEMAVNQVYDWLPTLPGTKIEETALLTDGGCVILSPYQDWPTFPVTSDGRTYRMPAILEG